MRAESPENGRRPKTASLGGLAGAGLLRRGLLGGGGRRVAVLGGTGLGEAGLERGGEVDHGAGRLRLLLVHDRAARRLVLDHLLDGLAILVDVLAGLELVAQ